MTRLAELLGIRVPVLLAAMAGGPGTPALAAAVTRSGGLGVLGISGMSRELAAAAIDEARRAADGPIGVNAMLAPATPATGDAAAIAEVLRPFRRELGLAEDAPEASETDTADAPGDLVAAAVAAGANVVTTFGHPGPVSGALADAGVPLVAMVTTPAEAVAAVELGAAAVIAQGAEAGGHRGTFEVGADALPLVGLLALVPAVVDAVGPDIPVVASGGIVDRAGVDAVFAVGASGVSCGTVFLQAGEAGVGEAYRRSLLETAPDGSVVTDVVTGRPARWIRNRFVDALVEAGVGHLGWPRQAAAVWEIRAAAAGQGRADILPMLAGQRSAATGSVRPAAEIVAELVPSALLG